MVIVTNLSKMNFVCILFVAVILNTIHKANCSANSKLLKSTYACKDDICLKNDHITEISVHGQLADEEIFKIENVSENRREEGLNSFLKNVSNLRSLQDLINITINETSLVNNADESTETPESTLSFEENSLSTTTLKSEDKSVTSLSKLNASLTTPFLQFFSLQNHRGESNICICDLTFNQCDINCCCDKDCSLIHFRVFTKCSNENTDDTKYCIKSSFLFKNNTLHKIIQDEGGLFCVIKNNLKVSLKFKTKPVIKTLDAFNTSLPKYFYYFSSKNNLNSEFMGKDYKAGLPVWIVVNGEVKPFGIPAATVGFLCTSQLNIKFLINQVTKCSYQNIENEIECGKSGMKNIFHYLKDTKIISNPGLINKSQVLNFTKICHSTTCIGITFYMCKSFNLQCVKISENLTDSFNVGCWGALSMIEYHIWHNGSEGIKKFEAYVWIRNLLGEVGKQKNFLLTTKVKYSWIGQSGKMFERSGNPGYLIGRPILMGRKVYLTNGTNEKKEAIELSFDKNNWLSVVGSEKGICSSKKRIPINFGENGQYKCILQLTKDKFSKEKCRELQNTIFKLLIGTDIVNATNNNYFNKFIATFGNSKVEETGDWVQVMIDLFALIPSQIAFKSNYNNVICKNIITDIYINVAYANVGSFMNPQSKILGVRFHFGKHKDLLFYCDTPNCDGTKLVQNYKLSSMVHFIDLTEPAADAFAEPLSLEAKLPYDFFYPFFSGGCFSHSLTTYIFHFFMVYLLVFVQ